MGHAVTEIDIHRSADVVWDAIRDYADPFWRGGIATCTLEGSVRTVTTLGVDLVIEETEFAHDEANRTFTYGVTAMQGDTVYSLPDGTTIDLASMAGHHRATMTVVPLDDASSRVVYELTVDEGHDETFPSTAGQYRQVLALLKAQLEG
jgi:hypothetical protein